MCGSRFSLVSTIRILFFGEEESNRHVKIILSAVFRIFCLDLLFHLTRVGTSLCDELKFVQIVDLCLRNFTSFST